MPEVLHEKQKRENSKLGLILDWVALNKPYVAWGVVALGVGLGGFLGLLTLIGFTFIPKWLLPLVYFRVHPLAEATHGHVVTAAVSWLGGTIALYTYFLNRDQKEQHLQKQLEEQRNNAEQQRNLEERFELAREKRERDLAELQRLENLFGQLAEDFASDVPLNRINAAIGLAELAQTPDPRAGKDPKKTETNYPYFLRAVNRLAAAIHQWSEQPARDEVRKALIQMGAFAKVEGTDEPLLHALCNSLADANRTALGIFIETLAEGLACGQPLLLRKLVPFFAFLGWPAGNAACLNGLRKTRAAKLAFQRWATLRPALVFPTPGGVGADYLQRFARAAQSLLDARDALADALRHLSCPPGLPELPPEDADMRLAVKSYVASVHKCIKHCSLDLNGVMLQGACLRAAQLHGANLIGAHLQGADLRRTRLHGADLSGAQLQGADLILAHLQGTKLWDSQLQEADLTLAQLQGAKLCHAQLQGAALYGAKLLGADLFGANLQSADLLQAQLQGAKLKWAQLQGANLSSALLPRAELVSAQLQGADFSDADLEGARMCRAQCGQRSGDQPAKFSPGGWAVADFHEYTCDGPNLVRLDARDDDLIKWLDATYPAESKQDEPDEEAPEPDDDGEA